MKSAALISASYSARSVSLSVPSLARSASASIRSCTGGSICKSMMRRADPASRHRLSGSNRPSRPLAPPMLLQYHCLSRPRGAHRPEPGEAETCLSSPQPIFGGRRACPGPWPLAVPLPMAPTLDPRQAGDCAFTPLPTAKFRLAQVIRPERDGTRRLGILSPLSCRVSYLLRHLQE